MEETINSLDANVRRLSNYLERIMNENDQDYVCIMLQPGEASGSVGSMQDITSPYPTNMDTLSRLEIRTPCTSDAVFRITCIRDHIKHITVAGRTYSRQEIACMESGRQLGGGGGILDGIPTIGEQATPLRRPVGDVPEPETPWQPATTEAQRNIFHVPEPIRVSWNNQPTPDMVLGAEQAQALQQLHERYAEDIRQVRAGEVMGIHEQLQQATTTVAIPGPLDLEEMIETTYRIARNRRALAISNDDTYF